MIKVPLDAFGTNTTKKSTKQKRYKRKLVKHTPLENESLHQQRDTHVQATQRTTPQKADCKDRTRKKRGGNDTPSSSSWSPRTRLRDGVWRRDTDKPNAYLYIPLYHYHIDKCTPLADWPARPRKPYSLAYTFFIGAIGAQYCSSRGIAAIRSLRRSKK